MLVPCWEAVPWRVTCLTSVVAIQGVEGWDVDLPTYMEANVITTTAVKVAWVFCYILVYGLRPVIVRPKKVGERGCNLAEPSVDVHAFRQTLTLCGQRSFYAPCPD